jgi:uncharacterized protein (DUF302 family)
MSDLEIVKIIDLSFDDTEKKVVASLKEQGFGILTEIDVKKVLKTKLDVDFEQYKILGACNPVLAHKALNLDRRMGTLLPCNVYLQSTEEGKTKVAAIDPETMFSVIDNPQMEDIVKEAKERLTKAINDL